MWQRNTFIIIPFIISGVDEEENLKQTANIFKRHVCEKQPTVVVCIVLQYNPSKFPSGFSKPPCLADKLLMWLCPVHSKAEIELYS